MTPEERVAYLEHLDKVIRSRNTWDDMRALDAYLSLWEMAYGPARLAVQVSAAARAVVEQEEPGAPTDQLDRDLDVLARVGRMYLDALDSDPENEMLTLPEAMLVTEVRAAVERREASWEPAERPEPARSAPARIHVRHDPAALMEEPDLYADEQLGLTEGTDRD